MRFARSIAYCILICVVNFDSVGSVTMGLARGIWVIKFEWTGYLSSALRFELLDGADVLHPEWKSLQILHCFGRTSAALCCSDLTGA